MLKVFLNHYKQRYFVGILKEYKHKIFFEYDKNFLKTGIEISPFYLPLKAGVFEEKKGVFHGLFGVFNDSLPDGWGCLLLDKYLQKQGLSYNEISPLMRLSLTGKSGMGALEYEPSQEYYNLYENINLDELQYQSNLLLNEQDINDLEQLITLNGSSGGARPKIVCYVSEDKKKLINQYKTGYESWIIKFSSKFDPKNIGVHEYVYSLLAKEAGLIMPETYLFESTKNAGYFGVKRFDRTLDNKKIHIHTAAGLLHCDFRVPSLDYADLMKLTSILTKDKEQVKNMLRLMVFNIKSENKDDHAKNFSFLLDENYQWKLTPAYDLTQLKRSEHFTTVNGKGKDITNNDIIKLAHDFDFSSKETNEIIEQTENALSHYQTYMK